MALIYNASFDSQTHVLSLLDKAGNVISSCEVPSKGDPLTLTATADHSSVTLTENGTLSNTYEVNTGSGWTAYGFGATINLNAGQSCKWRCSAHPTTQSLSNYVNFVMTGTIEASGNCNSMLSSDFDNITSLTGYDFAFYNLFKNCTALTKSPELPSTILATSCYHNMFAFCSSLTRVPELTATTLATECYNSMFFGCSSLTQATELPSTILEPRCYSYMFTECTALKQAPELPATTLAVACYVDMFRGCRSLKRAPELPASTLTQSCYAYMFKDCSALTQAPSLPATTLANYCYQNMFSGCTSLTSAPQLPATKLASYCYASMFYGCTSLTQSPNLPATTLAGSCYRNMFENCSALAEVRIAATTTAEFALNNWLLNVASSGTVYAAPNFNDLPTNSVSGVPSGWRRLNINDYPQT